MQNGENRPQNDRLESGRIARFRVLSKSLRENGEAYSIGWVLMASILAPCLLGLWLDNRYKTSFWTPLLFLVGAAWGFTELFRTVTRMSKRQEANRVAEKQATIQAPKRRSYATSITPPSSDEVVQDARPKPRLFEIPAPPMASFEGGAKLSAPQSTEESDEVGEESSEELIRRLLNEPPDDKDKNAST